MNKRQRSSVNSRTSQSSPNSDLIPYSARRLRHQPFSSSTTRVVAVTVGLLALLLLGWFIAPGQGRWLPSLTAHAPSDTLRRAVNRAMSAAELTQTASTQEEWKTVEQWWEEAIALMAAVEPSNPNYDLAQAKVEEYGHNLAYAQQQISQTPTAPTLSKTLWSTGSAREQVIQAQGEPTRSVRYDPLCQEVLYYGDSTVELTNGTVSDYRDMDGKFRVSAHPPDVRVVSGSSTVWTLGSGRDEIFRIQGTPNRVETLDLPNVEILYYGESSITLVDGQVVGYNNVGKNLKLSVEAIATPVDQLEKQSWNLGSSRGDVLRIQGIPEQVTSEGLSCSEVLYYGASKVELHNGSVSAYDNAAGNLRVFVQ